MKILTTFLLIFFIFSHAQAKDKATCKTRLLTKAEDLCAQSINLHSKYKKKLSDKKAKKRVAKYIQKQMVKTCKRNCSSSMGVSCNDFWSKKKKYKFCSDFYDSLVRRLRKINFFDSEQGDLLFEDLIYRNSLEETDDSETEEVSL